MTRSKLSAAIATYNEEENIVDCLESIKNLAEEVVIADGSSTDRTRELATKLGAKVIKTTNKPMFHINKNLAINNCHGDWILLLDADERVSKKLAAEIKETISNKPDQNGFWINRRNWFLGDFLSKGGAYPDSVIRLIRRGKGHLPEKSVHEQIRVEGEVGQLKNDIIHFADPSFKRYLERANRYTSLTAKDLKNINPGKGTFTAVYFMIFKPVLTFINIYIRHKGFQDGFRGFIWALFSSAHHFYAYVKYWQEKDFS